MQPQPVPIEMFERLRAQMLDELGHEPPPIEVTEAGLVTLTLTEHGTVSDLKLPDDLAATDPKRLAQALIAAYNNAKTEVTLRRRQRFAAAVDGDEPASRD
jgi:DNA-binding protein YbaB